METKDFFNVLRPGINIVSPKHINKIIIEEIERECHKQKREYVPPKSLNGVFVFKIGVKTRILSFHKKFVMGGPVSDKYFSFECVAHRIHRGSISFGSDEFITTGFFKVEKEAIEKFVSSSFKKRKL